MVQQVPSPCVLVEMGSGNSEKSRIFIDAILEQQPTLQYMPVDISKGCYRKSLSIRTDRFGANSADPDQTASFGSSLIWSTLFASPSASFGRITASYN